jgi:hypothetical protein
VNRTIKDIDGFPGFLAAVATGLLATMAAAHGQEVPAAPQNQNPSSAPASSTSSTKTPAPNSSSSSSEATADSGSKSDPVCFKLTGHCVDASKAPPKPAPTKTARTNGKKLNLTAPDVSTVVPEQELKEPLQNQDQINEVQESQTVSVKTNEGVPPDVPGGLGAIWWAVVHPSQAWRIVAPAE